MKTKIHLKLLAATIYMATPIEQDVSYGSPGRARCITWQPWLSKMLHMAALLGQDAAHFETLLLLQFDLFTLRHIHNM